LESLLERDLLGPWDGPEEELPPGVPPAEVYLLGRLVPRARPITVPLVEQLPMDLDPELVDREVTDGGADQDTDGETAQATRSGSMAASALGLSFWVPRDVERVVVEASWGRYAPTASEIHVTEQGRPRTVWKRTPAGGSVEVLLAEGDAEPLVIDPEQEGVVLRATVRVRGGRRMVDLALVNDQSVPPSSVDTVRLYQVALRVTALDGAAAIFVGNNDPELAEPPPTHDDERLQLALLYRERRQYAHGRQCAVDAEVRESELRAWRLTTTCFPAADVRLTVAGDPGETPGIVLDMARLGSPELARDDLVRALRPLAAGYRAWLGRQQQRLTEPEIAAYTPAGELGLERAELIADRLDRAVDLLRDDGVAREAFRFANQAMALQRVRSEVTRRRTADPSLDLGALLTELDVLKNRSWKPFQLAFVLLCLPGLTDPEHRDAHRGEDAEVQLLFFPTGGGKTEAYLGLTAYTFAIRRLQGVVGAGLDARDGTDGVAVLMRYTLRLLTAQQFQRAAALVCACEWLRRERIAAGDGRWGATPFRIGLWVGSKVTPNNFAEAKNQVEDARGQDDALGGPLQLAVCPWCGQRLSAGASLRTDGARHRVLLFCSDPEGDCPFSPRNSPDEGLPVVTVDEEIYRLTPSLVIGTVDKFAQLPWKAATATLFGLVDSRCPRHGWKNPDFEGFCKGDHRRTTSLPATQPEPAMRLRPPDLIIQDELHLIADALGSMVGLYETVIDYLASRTNAGRTVRPVVVASTATVRRARDQVAQVFARGLTVFPAQVIDAGETFFSTVKAPTKDTPSRRYRGICATGERMKSVQIRVAAAVLEHAQYLLDRHGQAADPYMSLVGYFSSTRELAGMRRLVDDDIADRLASLRVRTRRRRPTVAELTSRMPSSRIASTLAELERGFDAVADSSDHLEQLRRNPKGADRSAARALPLDVLLATSMLQVGVDVQRLGLMVVAGQPKNTAEYIQATSRVGRDTDRPGLVLTVYQWSRPRDLAHYESFAYDHATFGMRVEGLTTTPFSDRAVDRGLTAVVAALLRHAGPASLPNTAAATVPLSGPSADTLMEILTERAAYVTDDNARTDQVRAWTQHRLDRWAQRRSQVKTGVLGYEQGIDVTGLLHKPNDGSWDLWSAPMSLREVEPEILLQMSRRDAATDDAPPWSYDRPQAGKAR
jgi:hypothetical protein